VREQALSLIFLAPDSLQVFQLDLVPFWLPSVLRLMFWVRSRVPLPTAEHASPVPTFLLNPPTGESSRRSPLQFFSAPSPVLRVLASSACPCFLISFSCSSIRWRRQCVALLFTFCCSLLVPVARPDFLCCPGA
jgi:hypothetical protein